MPINNRIKIWFRLLASELLFGNYRLNEKAFER
jgi:hypothetical protein